MQNIDSRRDTSIDIYLHVTAHGPSFEMLNGASIKDLGEADYENVKAPAVGYSKGRVKVEEGRVYAVKSNDKKYFIIKVTSVSQDNSIDFLAREAAVDNGQISNSGELYYLTEDESYFDLAAMGYVTRKDAAANIRLYFSPRGLTFEAINGASIKDLGSADYVKAKVPSAGYTARQVRIENNHIYAVKCKDKVYSVIKVTNLDQDSNIEFMARAAELEIVKETKVSKPKVVDTKKDTKTKPNVSKPTKKTTKAKDICEVQDENKLILNGNLLFQDKNGIYSPCLSPDKKYVAYTSLKMEIKRYDIKNKTIEKIYDLPFSEAYGTDTVYGHVEGYRVYPTEWTDDSKYVIYKKFSSSGYKGGDSFYKVSKDGGEPIAVKKN
jgi:hypothetical protein